MTRHDRLQLFHIQGITFDKARPRMLGQRVQPFYTP